MKGFLKALKTRPLTLIFTVVLVLLYLSMIFAEFIAPYSPGTSFPKQSYYPPAISWYSCTGP